MGGGMWAGGTGGAMGGGGPCATCGMAAGAGPGGMAGSAEFVVGATEESFFRLGPASSTRPAGHLVVRQSGGTNSLFSGVWRCSGFCS